MIHVCLSEEKHLHDLDSTTCNCNPAVLFEYGEMIVVHESILSGISFDLDSVRTSIKNEIDNDDNLMA
jgi:hypothetical protein